MSINQDDRKPLPSVEFSQKYMSWHMKEMNESQKMMVAIFKNMAANLEKIASSVSSIKMVKQLDHPSLDKHTDEIPF